MLYLFVFIFGLCFGSFFNVLIYRLPLNKSIIHPRSFCPKCKTKIKNYYNIPLLSYIILRRKCAHCQEKISFIYPLVESITALVTLLVFMKFGLTRESFYIITLFYLLIVLSFIDFKYKAVPDYLLIMVFLVSLLAVKIEFFTAFSNGLLFAGAFIILDFLLTFYIQNIKYIFTKDKSLKVQKALGEGDIPIVFVIGIILGIKAGVTAIFLAAIFAMIPSLYNTIFKKEVETPFIPYLSLGFFIEFIFSISKSF